jgi:hypothetical protein
MLLRTEFPHWGQTVQLEFSKPYYKDLTKKLNVSIGSTSVKQPSSGYQEHIIGHKLEYKVKRVSCDDLSNDCIN